MALQFRAFDAGAGDALLVSSDDAAVLIDGGESGNFRRVVAPRLEANQRRLDDALLTHWDNDHLLGIRDLFLLPALEDSRPANLLFNEFSSDSAPPSEIDPLEALRVGALGVDDARHLLDLLRETGTHVEGTRAGDVREYPSFDIAVIGPTDDLLAAARDEWEEALSTIPEVAAGIMAADDSATNRASITCVVRDEDGAPQALLTGDALGTDVISQLELAGFLSPGDQFDVQLVKLPHHGSDRNVDMHFLERIRADHWVISANGRHSNPDLATVERLMTRLAGTAATVWFTSSGNTRAQQDHIAEMRAHVASAGIAIGNTPDEDVVIRLA